MSWGDSGLKGVFLWCEYANQYSYKHWQTVAFSLHSIVIESRIESTMDYIICLRQSFYLHMLQQGLFHSAVGQEVLLCGTVVTMNVCTESRRASSIQLPSMIAEKRGFSGWQSFHLWSQLGTCVPVQLLGLGIFGLTYHHSSIHPFDLLHCEIQGKFDGQWNNLGFLSCL